MRLPYPDTKLTIFALLPRRYCTQVKAMASELMTGMPA
jgi:hypothetical protein